MTFNVVGKEPLGLSELKAELTAIQKRDGELGFRSGKTLEYVNSFSTIEPEKFNEAKKAEVFRS
jgi:DNA-directed RNA polymerase subunit F